MKYKEAAATDEKYIFRSYGRLPVMLARGRGVYLYGDDGKRYLDMLAGLAVNALGHANPRIAAAITKQAKTKCRRPTNWP